MKFTFDTGASSMEIHRRVPAWIESVIGARSHDHVWCAMKPSDMMLKEADKFGMVSAGIGSAYAGNKVPKARMLV